MRSQIKSYDEYIEEYQKSVDDPESFWSEFAENEFEWIKKWDQVLKYDFLNAKFSWFEGAKLNITQNCLDRHLEKHGEKNAIIWEPNDPNKKTKYISYKKLHKKVSRFANVLKNHGIKKGDKVCIYLPMIPELAIAVLACARIGAVHSVVFAGFSAKSLSDRINDSGCKILITSDGGFRGDKITPLKEISDEALQTCPTINSVIVVKSTKTDIVMIEGRDYWWKKEYKKADANCQYEAMDAEDELFVLYTSGSTGKPKGMVHTCAGYMVYTNYTFRNVFQYKENDIYWCTADIGWITGHSYILYGPLSLGATTLMFEGVPSYPKMDRFWEIVAKHRVNIFYTAPTAIRALAKCDLSLIKKHDLSSLKTLGTVGEPINQEAWEWYDDNIGNKACPIVDTWWQTETGGIMISSLAGVTPDKPTFATYPLPGIQPALMDNNGDEITEMEAEGKLCIKFPWPGMARTIYGDHERFITTYFKAFPGKYFTGDGCRRNTEGMYRITGRVDDIVIVSGHNLGTAEIENCIDEHELVAEAAVVGYPHDIKGHAIYAFVSCYQKVENEENLIQEILALVSHDIGPIAKPEKIAIVSGLPKTRSGKIMRRILRKIASNEIDQLGDTSTLLNPEVVNEILENLKT